MMTNMSVDELIVLMRKNDERDRFVEWTRYESSRVRPVYGSFWRWLFRKPSHYEIRYTFTVNPYD